MSQKKLKQHKKQLEDLYSKIQNLIDYACDEFDFANFEIVGILEAIKLDFMDSQMRRHKDDDDDDEDGNEFLNFNKD